MKTQTENRSHVRRIPFFRGALIALLAMVTACSPKEGLDPLALFALLLAGAGVTVNPSGTVKYQHVPVDATNKLLNTAGITVRPARFVTVQLLDAGDTVVASTTSSNTGAYSLSGSVAGGSFTIRMASEMKRTSAPTYEFHVKNAAPSTTVGSDYAVASSSQAAGGCSDSCTVDVTALDSNRGNSPFAILDIIRTSIDKIYTADAGTVFPLLHVKWQNGSNNGSYFTTSSSTCGTGVARCIVLLGNRSADSDEFDWHVVAHEFTHYLENSLSRSDSIGGAHSSNDLLEPRVAYGEGLGNAMGAIFNNDPVYTDTTFAGGFGFSMETGTHTLKGYPSEGSVQTIIWDLFDSTNEGADALSLGFTPLWQSMLDLKNITGFTYLHEFVSALRIRATGNDASITAILGMESVATNEAGEGNKTATVSGTYTGIGVTGHTCDGSTGAYHYNPVVTTVAGTGANAYGATAHNGSLWCGAVAKARNKLFGSQFFKVTPTNSGTMTVVATDTASDQEDPDVLIFNRGVLVAIGQAVGSDTVNYTVVGGTTYIVEIRTWSNCLQTTTCAAGTGTNAYTVRIDLPN